MTALSHGGLTRRRLITTGLTAAAGVTGLGAAARMAARYGLIPPDSGGLYGAGATLTYAAQRLITDHGALAREFDRSQISKVAPMNGRIPENDEYQSLLRRHFEDWRLDVDGMVGRPASFSLADLKRLPMRTQITHQACEEGWSFIAEWNGVAVADILSHVRVSPDAKYVAFFPFDSSWDSLDIVEAWHPQTLLAYGMNGRELPIGHGAPVRLRVPKQLGYKSVKYLASIMVVDSLKDLGDGLGSSSPALGYSWYAGI